MVLPVLVVTRSGRMHLAKIESNKGVPSTFVGVDDKTYSRVPWLKLEDQNLSEVTEVFEEQR